MKPPPLTLRLLGAIVLLVGFAAALHAWFARLPHTVLSCGGEFRVYEVRYGAGWKAHAFRRAPEWEFGVWDALPTRLQNMIPSPEQGPPAESNDYPSISIWCAWIDPNTHQPTVSEFGKATVTFDDGESLPRMWPIGADDYREILIVDPPHDSRYLRVKLRVWSDTGDEIVHFKVKNPAYHQP